LRWVYSTDFKSSHTLTCFALCFLRYVNHSRFDRLYRLAAYSPPAADCKRVSLDPSTCRTVKEQVRRPEIAIEIASDAT
jgi:hypothetical protein